MAFKATDESTVHLKLFTKKVHVKLEKYAGLTADQLTEIQRNQVEGLTQIERDFRSAIIENGLADVIYKHFLEKVSDNILHARPFFRERSRTFSDKISPAVRAKNINALKTFDINYHFIRLVAKKLPDNPIVIEYVKKVEAAREELVLMNIPLVIDRASKFWRVTQKSHLSFMDLVQIGQEGLIAAIDKYAGTYSKVWRSVVIGRITGNYIYSYSSTMLHFYPKDRRKLYRANKAMAKGPKKSVSMEDVVSAVNNEIPEKQKSTEFEIQQLMAAASVTSYDHPEFIRVHPIEIVEDDERVTPAQAVEDNDLRRKTKHAILNLSVFDRKLLRMKGIES